VVSLPFTDAHVHFYDMSRPDLRYEWLEAEAEDPDLGDYGAIKALRYWADDFIGETRFQNVEKVVHVQAATGTSDPTAETAWLQSFADRTGVPHGIVAYADLGAPDVADALTRHAAFPNLRGIRDLRYDDYLSDPQWLEGYRMLANFGLVCCDDPAVDEMPLAAELARRVPEVTLCVDHAGYPRERTDDYFRRWREGMQALGKSENTVVKISGLGMCDHRWSVESIRPWVLTCIEAFGADRSFFGTNWPVDRLFSSYGDVLDAYAEIISEFSPTEQRALFSGNANRIFRIES
jgi:predicted TIM-barrel fold metal-dependent hydrolase